MRQPKTAYKFVLMRVMENCIASALTDDVGRMSDFDRLFNTQNA